ncbi:MAG: hypothetical protein HY832_03245 [Candidatus Aenigmarchaeota archaeon]|nr:hypothetical protein [Candidatus Aenigmarchaeota archaeon]
MGKIEDYIKKHKITPRDCTYHTNREGRNKENKQAGYVRVLVPKTSTTAMVEYVCPECSYAGYLEMPWDKRFAFKCQKCSYRMSVSKLRAEVKREKQKEKKTGVGAKELTKEDEEIEQRILKQGTF